MIVKNYSAYGDGLAMKNYSACGDGLMMSVLTFGTKG